MESLQKSLQDVRNEMKEVIKSLEFAHEEIVSLKESLKAVNQEKNNMVKECQSLKDKLNEAVPRLDYIDDQSRRYNLRFSGFGESGGENYEQTEHKLSKFIADKTGITPNLERAHRVGKPNKNPRDIVVRFATQKQRDSVLAKRKQLTETSVYMNEDFCPATVEARKKLIPQLKAARSDGKFAYLSYRKLIIKNQYQRQATTTTQNYQQPAAQKQIYNQNNAQSTSHQQTEASTPPPTRQPEVQQEGTSPQSRHSLSQSTQDSSAEDGTNHQREGSTPPLETTETASALSLPPPVRDTTTRTTRSQHKQ